LTVSPQEAVANVHGGLDMGRLLKLFFWIALGFFCWGWISNVALGKMTTSQYLHMLDAQFQQWVISGTEKILQSESVAGIIRRCQIFYGARGV